jgi:hypothetical protein
MLLMNVIKKIKSIERVFIQAKQNPGSFFGFCNIP